MENPFNKSESQPELGESELPQPDPLKDIVLPVTEPEAKLEESKVEKPKLMPPEVLEEFKTPAKTRKQMILEEYGGLESNVPINSAYWQI